MMATLWLLLLVPLLLGLGTHWLLQSVFRRHRSVRNHAAVTGAEVARALLHARGLRGVRLELVPGFLTAAALTYVVGLLDRLGFFLAVLFVSDAAWSVAR
jgi:Zn-dependent membrane protease YugP